MSYRYLIVVPISGKIDDELSIELIRTVFFSRSFYAQKKPRLDEPMSSLGAFGTKY